ncbi:MAG: hypothetical protein HZA28_02755 [Candidatus Omnitrophica bacterium]|nr:hypothetical protein [Candidatus Omnitrophota bacterium]
MNKIIFLLILWFLVFFLFIMYPINGFTQEDAIDTPVPEDLPVRNPFEPQIPREADVVQQPKPVPPVDVKPREIPQPSPVVVPPVELPRPIVQPQMPALNIGGIVWNTQHPQAIVNGQIVGVGDLVAGVRIVDIQKTGVTVSAGDRTVTIEMQR